MFKYSNRYRNPMICNGDYTPKPCKECGQEFKPVTSANIYCLDRCADRGYSRKILKKQYDLTLEEYESMKSDPHCRICGSEGFIISRNGKAKLAIDHDHSTGLVRGMLCHNCNRALGLMKDDIRILQKAIEYLKGATTISKESTDKCLEAPNPENLLSGDDIV